MTAIARPQPRVVPAAVAFRVAAGPRVGFGHLVRARSLARALGVHPIVSIRGGPAAAHAAGALGCRVRPGTSTAWLRREPLALLVIDDPSRRHAAVWCRAARRAGLLVASVHDMGLGLIASDLVVDGSIRPSTRVGSSRRLLGTRYMILDPAFASAAPVPPARRPTLLIALGGARRQSGVARLARAVARCCPGVRVLRAPGIHTAPPAPGRRARGPHDHGLWRVFSTSAAAIVGGGVTMYEACALGIPAIAVAVVPGQRRAIRALAARGAVVDGGSLPPAAWSRGVLDRLAAQAMTLIHDPRRRRGLAAAARRQIDGRGALRVARAIRSLIRTSCEPAVCHETV